MCAEVFPKEVFPNGVARSGYAPIRFLGQLQGGTVEERADATRAHAEGAAFTQSSSAWVVGEEEWLSQIALWWEWEHVTNVDGLPMRVSMTYNNLKDHARCFPRCPVVPQVARYVRFTPEHFISTASAYCKRHALPECSLLGVLYEGDFQQFSLELPNDGCDVLEKAVYWRLPHGTVRCWSLARLLRANGTELKEEHCEAAYHYMGLRRDLLCLGDCGPEELEMLRSAVVKDKPWASLPFQLPAAESSPCFWVTNKDAEGDATVQVLRKSLAMLEIEVLDLRMATPLKLRERLQQRMQGNRAALANATANTHWLSQPIVDLDACSGKLDKAQIRALQAWAGQLVALIGATAAESEAEQLRRHGAEQMVQWLQRLSSTQRDEVFEECFPDTPRGCYEEIWEKLSMLETRVTRRVERHALRLAGMAAHVSKAAEEEGQASPPSNEQCDPDGYGATLLRLPKGHEVATAHAEAVMLDRMQASLELHYDRAFKETWAEKHAERHPDLAAASRPQRRRLQQRALECLKHQRYEALEIPAAVRAILTKPRQEAHWDIMEELATVLRSLVCGVREVELYSAFEVQTVADELMGSQTGVLQRNHRFVHGVLYKGSQVVEVIPASGVTAAPAKREVAGRFARCRTSATTTPTLAEQLRLSSEALPVTVRVHDHPRGESREVPLGKFGQAVLGTSQTSQSSGIRDIAKPYIKGEVCAEAVLELLLVEFGMVQWCAMIDRWSARDKGWTSVEKVKGAIRWYMLGQHLGSAPVYDGLCAYCGSLLCLACNSRTENAILANRFFSRIYIYIYV